MEKRIYLLLVVMAAVMCLGMGGGGQGGIEIPEPARDFSATLVDRSGLSIVLNRFSCDGSTFFFGKMGMADASVDFDRIRSATFEKAENGTVTALIRLKDGDTVRLVMKGDMACYGSSTVADVRILLADIQELEIQGGDE